MIGSFCLIYWLQSLDKNFNKKTKFDKFKIPILASALIGLISQTCSNSSINLISNKIANNQEIFTEVADF